jgi:hypothetical protein
MSPLTLLYAVRDRFVAARPPPPELRRAIRLLESVPDRARPRIAAALGERIPALACLSTTETLSSAYPFASRAHQARLVLGEPPARILRGLTRREGLPPTHVRSVGVARWLVACWRDSARRAALERDHIEVGPHGEEIHGRLLERVDEIADRDLARGAATGVREAFHSAASRAYERWTREVESQHDLLAPVPSWWRPIRCARLLMSAAQLVAEGRAQRHCVGTYARYVRQRQSVIVAVCVRSRGETYRSTAELARDGSRVLQHKGAGNGAPPPICARALAACLRRWQS